RAKQRMAAIEARFGGDASLRGPVAYALGRGHLAMREFAQALPRLEAAWNAGQRGPDLELALGRTLAWTYAGRVRDLDPERDRQKVDELQRRYRQPALLHLGHAQGATRDAPEYVEALIALYEDRYQDALLKAQAAFRHSPSFYEALEIEAAAHLLQAAQMSR